MTNASDQEWLRLYRYLAVNTDLVRCKADPIVEVLMMLRFGNSDNFSLSAKELIKQLKKTSGQATISDRPWTTHWDQLGGDNSRSVHDIETGVHNVGVKAIKVFQLASEHVNNAEAFFSMVGNAVNFLSEMRNTISSFTVHVWIPFTTLTKGARRELQDEDNYTQRLSLLIKELQRTSPTPIFVNILTDANFLGSKASIIPKAEELADRLRSIGVLHTRCDRFWRGMYSCGGDPHF
eukprot:s290_g25.t1